MVKRRVLIVGKQFTRLTDYILSHGYEYILLNDVASEGVRRRPRQINCDFSSKEAILETVDSIDQRIDAVTSTYENYILPAAWIARHLDLPGMPIESAEACTDKFMMRSLFATAPEKISPDFALVKNTEQLEAFAAAHAFPLILKPANLVKSLLVTKNDSLDELQANYQKTSELIQDTYAQYAPHREPRIIVEEYLGGHVHAVDAFTGDDGEPQVLKEIVDYQTGYEIGFNDNFHYSRLLPTKLSAAEQASLRHCAALGIKALGMKNSPAHVEIIVTSQGPRLVEIGARNGGYRERMHQLANGLDIIGAALELAFGQKPILMATKDEPCAVLELFPKKPGDFVSLSHEGELRQLPSFHYLSVKAERGQYVGKSSDGFKMCAIIILHHHDKAQFAKDLEYVDTQVAVKTN